MTPGEAMEPGPASSPADAAEVDRLRESIVAVLRTCYDPEIPVDIYELGLIYEIDVDAERRATVRMTLTSPACPVAGSLPGEVEGKVRAIPGIHEARVELVWDPPWGQEMMSDAAKVRLGFF